ncbi:uracil phosphoribosyltransferase [Mycoplasmopsis californica HAZ160_1]|uniref:Uracil phosphoribosyltransferase n=2 Tax=Mycoplasmopsis californica TaxID=2113 RepID=A0A059XRM2_9BACT|nr:uracil phosphoribosyltransferase [Mycoplasmopsis californica]AIA29448.1 uracil phosphoribosyltransferase [Mycoplasmopsis californica]BAP01102.1 uracil phosphoribosyltransferase [Mycoplasmopsis californica HAZ160_1]BBG40968.1 uracil phosphoribosyltransferase [Mycoplasmopsis californica]BBG41561.1 uracil phosphoribosyltransferase [Mycoplasmopsis californica]BBG42155.1 uracil phosphoribosyltransferase [Mycoplasmopsis californica]
MLKVIEHPLISIKLTAMRDKNADHQVFRQNLNEIASLMVYEIMRDYKVKNKTILTPLNDEYVGATYDKEIVIVPILRAGLGMTEGLLKLIPNARVGHIGLYRDADTHEPETYFYKMPEVPKDSYILVVDPMLATGGSAVDAIKKLKNDGFNNIQLVCLVGVKEGVQNVMNNFGPNFNIFLASLDPVLNSKKYIVPGLGDAGDRIFGTK